MRYERCKGLFRSSARLEEWDGWQRGLCASGSSFFGYLYKRHDAFAALDVLVVASLKG